MQTGMKGDFMEYQYITQANIDIGAVLITDSAVDKEASEFNERMGRNRRAKIQWDSGHITMVAANYLLLLAGPVATESLMNKPILTIIVMLLYALLFGYFIAFRKLYQLPLSVVFAVPLLLVHWSFSFLMLMNILLCMFLRKFNFLTDEPGYPFFYDLRKEYPDRMDSKE